MVGPQASTPPSSITDGDHAESDYLGHGHERRGQEQPGRPQPTSIHGTDVVATTRGFVLWQPFCTRSVLAALRVSSFPHSLPMSQAQLLSLDDKLLPLLSICIFDSWRSHCTATDNSRAALSTKVPGCALFTCPKLLPMAHHALSSSSSALALRVQPSRALSNSACTSPPHPSALPTLNAPLPRQTAS